MTDVDEHGRPEPPVVGDERATLLGFLDYQRATFAWKTRGLDAGGLRTQVAASAMTLGGMMKHLALNEDWWFSCCLHDNPPAPPFDAVDFDADPDWEWRTAADDSPEMLVELWEEMVARSRAFVDEAYAAGGMALPAAQPWDDGRAPSLRWIVCHMIEEYARHNGHADLIREQLDGSTGE